ncbi:MAG: hypothetical protein COA32_10385 [Fluviicola sp.]|nr:MAG: hypothetical protein COA32_10385 [Fluviicola sp.]
MSRIEKNIPNQWQSEKFGDIFDFLSTATFSRNSLSLEDEGVGVFNIHYGDIHSTFSTSILDCNKEKLPAIIDEKVDINKLTFLQDGDLIIADASEDYEGVGKSAEIINVKDKLVTAGLHTFAVRDKSGLTTNHFRSYLLKHPWVENELKKLATGSKVYGVSKTNITDLELVLPPIKEQKKIAQILSTWDELIEKQTKLIEAKEKQKKGLMQRLLTGELRFPGFDEEWEEKKLGDIFIINAGKDLNVKYFSKIQSDEFNFPVYSNKLTSDGLYGFYRTSDYSGGKITVTARGMLGYSNPRFEDFMAIGRLLVLTPKVKLDITYVSEFINNMIEVFIESTGVPQLTAPQFSIYKIRLPKFKEQRKIASLLSEADKEIELLKKELTRFKEQKKGLMQQLLTGKIRV